MADTSVGLHGGRAVTRKIGGPGDAAGLLAEARALETMRHPGAVELVDVVQHADGSVELLTGYVGPHSLADLAAAGDLTAQRLARLAAEAAETLADAHDRGIAHGAVAAEHLLVGPGDRAVLCAWGAASASAAGDVAALGAMVAALLPEGDDAALRRALASIASNASAAVPSARPAMRGLAAALRAVLPLPRAATASAGARARARSWTRLLAAAAVCAALGGAGVVLVDAARGGARVGAVRGGDSAVAAGEDAPAPSPPATPSTRAPVRVWPRDDDTQVNDPPPLVHGGRRYSAGDPGDLVVLGDWDCDGVPTPAVLRNATGSVYVFSAWPAEGREVEGRSVGRVTGASTVRAVAGGGTGHCAELEVTRFDGTTVRLDPRR